MAQYQYRQLKVTIYDKHEHFGKRRGGSNPDRFCEVDDSSEPRPVLFLDQQGDDLWAVVTRANQAFLAYLNRLGGEGWQVISYHQLFGALGSEDYRWVRDFPPCGIYLLMRQEAGA